MLALPATKVNPSQGWLGFLAFEKAYISSIIDKNQCFHSVNPINWVLSRATSYRVYMKALPDNESV